MRHAATRMRSELANIAYRAFYWFRRLILRLWWGMDVKRCGEVCLLGKCITAEDAIGRYDDLQAQTYRDGLWGVIVDDGSRIASDNGFGCTVRSTQGLIANLFVHCLSAEPHRVHPAEFRQDEHARTDWAGKIDEDRLARKCAAASLIIDWADASLSYFAFCKANPTKWLQWWGASEACSVLERLLGTLPLRTRSDPPQAGAGQGTEEGSEHDTGPPHAHINGLVNGAQSSDFYSCLPDAAFLFCPDGLLDRDTVQQAAGGTRQGNTGHNGHYTAGQAAGQTSMQGIAHGDADESTARPLLENHANGRLSTAWARPVVVFVPVSMGQGPERTARLLQLARLMTTSLFAGAVGGRRGHSVLFVGLQMWEGHHFDELSQSPAAAGPLPFSFLCLDPHRVQACPQEPNCTCPAGRGVPPCEHRLVELQKFVASLKPPVLGSTDTRMAPERLEHSLVLAILLRGPDDLACPELQPFLDIIDEPHRSRHVTNLSGFSNCASDTGETDGFVDVSHSFRLGSHTNDSSNGCIANPTYAASPESQYSSLSYPIHIATPAALARLSHVPDENNGDDSRGSNADHTPGPLKQQPFGSEAAPSPFGSPWLAVTPSVKHVVGPLGQQGGQAEGQGVSNAHQTSKPVLGMDHASAAPGSPCGPTPFEHLDRNNYSGGTPKPPVPHVVKPPQQQPASACSDPTATMPPLDLNGEAAVEGPQPLPTTVSSAVPSSPVAVQGGQASPAASAGTATSTQAVHERAEDEEDGNHAPGAASLLDSLHAGEHHAASTFPGHLTALLLPTTAAVPALSTIRPATPDQAIPSTPAVSEPASHSSVRSRSSTVVVHVSRQAGGPVSRILTGLPLHLPILTEYWVQYLAALRVAAAEADREAHTMKHGGPVAKPDQAPHPGRSDGPQSADSTEGRTTEADGHQDGSEVTAQASGEDKLQMA